MTKATSATNMSYSISNRLGVAHKWRTDRQTDERTDGQTFS